jgi:TIGR03009 family protein
MRKHWLALPVLMAATAIALAQQAQQSVAPSAQDLLKLDDVLLQWEKAMGGLDNLLVYINRTSTGSFGGEKFAEVFEGTAKFIRGGRGQTSRASLELHKKGRPEVYEKLICTGTFIYEFDPGKKLIRIHELPPNKGGMADDNFQAFVIGMKAADAKKRYKLTYVPPKPNDKWYYYVKVEPIALADKAEFSEARLTLWANSYLPRQLWFKQPNANEVTWDFPRIVNGADIRVTEFEKPALPAGGWQYYRVPADVPPRVIRPNR